MTTGRINQVTMFRTVSPRTSLLAGALATGVSLLRSMYGPKSRTHRSLAPLERLQLSRTDSLLDTNKDTLSLVLAYFRELHPVSSETGLAPFCEDYQ